MKVKTYLICLIIPLFSGCAINYKPIGLISLSSERRENIGTPSSFPEIIKKTDEILFKNARLKKQLNKKGYKSYIISITNYTNDTLLIDKEHLYAIKDHQTIPYVQPEGFLKIIKFNRGLFLTISGYGLISPFSYAGRKLTFGKSQLIIALPLLAYGVTNAIIAYRSFENLKLDIKEHYIVGKTILPSQTVSGFVIIKTQDDDFEFVYKTVQ